MQDIGFEGGKPPTSIDAGAPVPLRSGRHGKGLTHELVEALGGQMRSGAIKPGDKLPTESDIVRRYGVSRGVVREALSRLQAAGKVQTHHGVGTFALAPTVGHRWQLGLQADGAAAEGIDDLLDVLELRTSIETDAAGLAAMRRGQQHLDEMHSALAEFERHLSVVGESVAPDFRFHAAIADATGNRYFSDMMGQLGLAVIPRTRVSSSWLDPAQRAAHLQKVNLEHQDILAAIERRDAEGARAAMRNHLVNSRERQRLAHARHATTPGPSSPTHDGP